MHPRPIQIKRLETEGLLVKWQDGSVKTLKSQTLRSNCPCASCKELRGDSSHQSPIQTKKPSLLKVIEHTKDEELSLEALWPVGNYAIGIKWKDGHDSGIYTYDLLYKL